MKAFVAAMGIGLCADATATTVVAIWSPVRIVISGDSMINSYWTGADGLQRNGLSSDCKIRKFGANYIAAAGNYRIQVAGFDLWSAAERACGMSSSIDSCTNALKGELYQALANVSTARDVRVALVVAGRQYGAPALDHVTVVGSPSTGLRVQSESFRRGRRTWGQVILGDRDAIDRYEQGGTSMRGSIQEQALLLVRLEARTRPHEVGAPFSTLAIDANTERWIIPGCCPAACSQ